MYVEESAWLSLIDAQNVQYLYSAKLYRLASQYYYTCAWTG